MAKARPDKKNARPGDHALNLQIDSDIRFALDAFIAEYNHNEDNEHHATIRSTVEAALKLYLKGKGHWPPKMTS